MNEQLLWRSRTQALQLLWQGWKLLLCLLVLTNLNALAQSNDHEYSVLTFDSPINSEVAIRLGTGPGSRKPVFEGAELVRQEEGAIGTNPWFYLRLKDRKIRIYRTYSLGIENVESLVGLDVSNSPNMVSLTITDAPRLNQVLDLSSNNKLSVISLSQVGITGLNLSPNSPLISLKLQNISLPSLDVASQNELFMIDLEGVKLPRLEVADLAKLSVIKCSQSEIGSLSLRRCPKLREVEVPNIGLTQFEVEETPELWRLELNNNKLSSLDMSRVNNTGDYGIRLNASHNQLTRFTAGSIRYKTLEITNNQLAALDLSTTSAAKFISAHINKLNEVKLNPNSSIYSSSFIFNSLSLDAMTRFIGSLPRYTPGSDIDDFDHETNGRIYIRATIEPIPEGNRISKSLVKQAKDKGWIIGFYGENGFQDNYEGDPEEVVFYTITTEFNRREGQIRLSVTDPTHVRANTEVSVTVEPNTGYELATLTANGKDIAQSRKFTVQGDTKVVATFRKKPVEIKRYPVTLEQGEGGRIRIKGMSPEDLKAVEEGTELTVSIARQEGYDLATLTANGVDIMANRKFVVREATVVKATFRKRTYKITLEQGEGGTISIEGKSTEDLNAVEDGTELTVLVAPKEGYELERLTASGKDITESKRFRAEAHTTVRATFRKKVFRVSHRVEGKGSITFTGADNLSAVPYGTELQVVTANGEGHELTSLTAGGEDILQTKRITVKSSIEVVGIFTKKVYVVTLPEVEHATVRIKGNHDLNRVPYETELELEVKPERGYIVEEVKVNGNIIVAPYKFVVKGDIKIEVRIKQDTAIGMVSRSSLRIYPNPASTYIIIGGNADTAKQVRLLNLVGRVVLEARTGANKRIDVSHLERGIYLLLVDGMAHRVVLR